MFNHLIYFDFLWFVFFIGLFAIFLSHKFKFESILILLGFGVVLQYLNVVYFSSNFLKSFVILLFSLILFDKFSRIKAKGFDTIHSKGLLIAGVVWLTSAVGITSLVYLLFDLPLLLALLVGTVISSSTVHFYKKHYLASILEAESLYTNVFSLLSALIIVIGINHSYFVLDYFSQNILPFFETILMSIGLGILMGLLFFRSLKSIFDKLDSLYHKGEEHIHHAKNHYFFLVLLCLLITYFLAAGLNADGFLAIATVAFMFGYFFVKNREELSEYPHFVVLFIELFIFIFVGYLVRIPFANPVLLLVSLYIYVMYLLLRYISIYLVLKDVYSIPERLFITLNNPKSLTSGSIILFLLFSFNGMEFVATLLFLFMIYSIVFSLIGVLIGKKLRIVLDYTEKSFEHKTLRQIKRDAKLHLKWFHGLIDSDSFTKKKVLSKLNAERDLLSDSSYQYDLPEISRSSTLEVPKPPKKSTSKKSSDKISKKALKNVEELEDEIKEEMEKYVNKLKNSSKSGKKKRFIKK